MRASISAQIFAVAHIRDGDYLFGKFEIEFKFRILFTYQRFYIIEKVADHPICDFWYF